MAAQIYWKGEAEYNLFPYDMNHVYYDKLQPVGMLFIVSHHVEYD